MNTLSDYVNMPFLWFCALAVFAVIIAVSRRTHHTESLVPVTSGKCDPSLGRLAQCQSAILLG